MKKICPQRQYLQVEQCFSEESGQFGAFLKKKNKTRESLIWVQTCIFKLVLRLHSDCRGIWFKAALTLHTVFSKCPNNFWNHLQRVLSICFTKWDFMWFMTKKERSGLNLGGLKIWFCQAVRTWLKTHWFVWFSFPTGGRFTLCRNLIRMLWHL